MNSIGSHIDLISWRTITFRFFDSFRTAAEDEQGTGDSSKSNSITSEQSIQSTGISASSQSSSTSSIPPRTTEPDNSIYPLSVRNRTKVLLLGSFKTKPVQHTIICQSIWNEMRVAVMVWLTAIGVIKCMNSRCFPIIYRVEASIACRAWTTLETTRTISLPSAPRLSWPSSRKNTCRKKCTNRCRATREWGGNTRAL